MIEDRECITNLLDSGELDTRYTSEMHWANLVQKQSPKASELKIFASLPSLSITSYTHVPINFSSLLYQYNEFITLCNSF